MQILQALDRGLDRLYGWCGYVAAALLVTLAALIISSILSRLAGFYVPGLAEWSGYAMAGASFLALAYTFRNRGHIRVAILLNAVKGRVRHVLQLWCLLVASLFSCFLAYYLVKMTYVSWRLEDRSEGADAVLLWIPQSVMAFGAVVLAVCVVHSTLRRLVGAADPIDEQGPPDPASEP